MRLFPLTYSLNVYFDMLIPTCTFIVLMYAKYSIDSGQSYCFPPNSHSCMSIHTMTVIKLWEQCRQLLPYSKLFSKSIIPCFYCFVHFYILSVVAMVSESIEQWFLLKSCMYMICEKEVRKCMCTSMMHPFDFVTPSSLFWLMFLFLSFIFCWFLDICMFHSWVLDSLWRVAWHW